MKKPARILCVDDEKNVLKALERLLADTGYEFLWATNGPDALQLLQTEPEVQIILADYRMPEMNGVELLRKIYSQWPNTVRILLSGYADVGVVEAALKEGGIYRFVSKPWDNEELLEVIHLAAEKAETYG